MNGLALATSISGIISSCVLFFILKKRLGVFEMKPILSSFLRALLASFVMGAVCYCAAQKNFTFTSGILNRVLNLSLPVISGLISYIVFCFIFRVNEMQELWRWLIRKNKV